jgi:Amt family ammonium transporter
MSIHRAGFLTLLIPLLLLPDLASAQDAQADLLFVINNTWMMVATLLVFAMHLGFATLEAGLTRAKNTVNILFKNVCVLAIGVLTLRRCRVQFDVPW